MTGKQYRDTTLHAHAEYFKRRQFGFIVEHDSKRHDKQAQALEVLTDKTTVEFLYGGAAGGAKSWTGCAWLAFMCISFPGTKWFIGREELKRLRESTLITFFKVCKMYGIEQGVDFVYNGSDHYLKFDNGSRIDLLDLRYLPSDPLYERYGSVEYTGGWIEEGGEVNFGAYDTLKTRIGRHLNDKYGLTRKLFISCNPKKNWMHTVFYKPSLSGALPVFRKYLGALVQDNPFIEKDYIEALRSTTDKVKKERLLNGNWDYDDNPNVMCSYDDTLEMFVAKQAIGTEKYITVDVARYGSDKARILVWEGYNVIEQHEFPTSSTTQIHSCIEAMIAKHRIPRHRCIADEDGVGGGVVDGCKIKGFLNGSQPFDGENYANLQTQCAYALSRAINEHKLSFCCYLTKEQQDEIAEEIGQLQTWDVDNDRKLKIKPKEEIKRDIGRSPDWRDALLMRFYFDYRTHRPIDKNKLRRIGY